MALVFSSAFMFQALSEEYLNQRGLMVSMIAFVSRRCHHHQCPNERVPLTPHPLHGNLKMLPLIRDMFCQEQELTFRSRFEEILKIIFVYIYFCHLFWTCSLFVASFGNFFVWTQLRWKLNEQLQRQMELREKLLLGKWSWWRCAVEFWQDVVCVASEIGRIPRQ